MDTRTNTAFENAVCKALHAMDGGNWARNDADDAGPNAFQSEYGEKVNLMDASEARAHVATMLQEPMIDFTPTVEDIEAKMDDLHRILIDYDIDPHGNRFSQFFYVVNPNSQW